MDSLASSLIKIRPRERSGSIAANRFGYQQDYTICRIIQLHQKEQNYLVICDYHEDIVVLDDTHTPSKATFVQVKTKRKGNWTIHQLLKRNKSSNDDKLPSILGKLITANLNFKSRAKALEFASNAHLIDSRLKIDTTPYKTYSKALLPTKAVDKINDCLSKEIGTRIDISSCSSEITFRKIDLSVDDHATHTVGRMSRFLRDKMPTSTIDCDSLYETLKSEIERKTFYEFQPQTFEEVKDRKGISRDDFESMVQLSKSHQYHTIRERIERQLQTEGVAFSRIRQLLRSLRQVRSDLLDATNERAHFYRDCCARRIIESSGLETHNMTLLALSSEIAFPVSIITRDQEFINADYLLALTMWLIIQDDI